MYRIRLIYDVPGWADYRRCHGIAKYAPDDFQVDVGRGCPRIDESDWRGYDLILNLMPDDNQTLRQLLARREEASVIVDGIDSVMPARDVDDIFDLFRRLIQERELSGNYRPPSRINFS